VMTFPAGEVHAKFNMDAYRGDWKDYVDYVQRTRAILTSPQSLNSPFPSEVTLELRGGSSDEIFTILALADGCKDLGVRFVDLMVYYMPYGRQDRVTAPGEPMLLRTLSKLLSSTFRRITLVDPHSDVTAALLRYPRTVHQFEVMEGISRHLNKEGLYNPFLDESVVLVSPDQGATKKIRYVAQAFDKKVAYASKVRDTATGALSAFSVSYPSEFLAQRTGVPKFLIVDDLVDAGGSFIGLAAEIRVLFPTSQLYLATSFGLYTKGLGALLDGPTSFNHVYAGNISRSTVIPEQYRSSFTNAHFKGV
jgi:ribose-phosphate pyrophosphokinase